MKLNENHRVNTLTNSLWLVFHLIEITRRDRKKNNKTTMTTDFDPSSRLLHRNRFGQLSKNMFFARHVAQPRYLRFINGKKKAEELTSLLSLIFIEKYMLIKLFFLV